MKRTSSSIGVELLQELLNLMLVILYYLIDKRFQGIMRQKQEKVVIQRKLMSTTEVYFLKLLSSPSMVYKINSITLALKCKVDWSLVNRLWAGLYRSIEL